jgi:hypothetical protein
MRSFQQNAEEAKASRDKKFALLRRYMQLLKTTMIAFFLSTCIHVGCVSAYFYTYLYMNPDDPGKKQFYAATTTTPGINIGGKVVGGGGISTNAVNVIYLNTINFLVNANICKVTCNEKEFDTNPLNNLTWVYIYQYHRNDYHPFPFKIVGNRYNLLV